MARGCPSDSPIMYKATGWLQWCCTAIVYATVLPGIIGNILSFRILGYNKSRQRQVSTLYLRALAIADCFALIFGVLSMSLHVLLRPALGLRQTDTDFLSLLTYSYPWCNVRIYLTFSSYMIAVYIIVVFSVKRCLVVLRPFYWMKALTLRRARATLLGTVLGCLLFCLPALFSFNRFERAVREGNASRIVTSCAINLPVFKPFAAAISVVEFALPFLCTAVCNVAICAKVRQRRPPGVPLPKTSSSASLQQQLQQQQPERAVTRRLVMVGCAFLLLSLPRCAYQLLTLLLPGSYCSTAFANFLTVAVTLNSLNYGVNFGIYCVSERQFRRLAAAIVFCQSDRLRRLLSFMNEPGMQRPTRESTPTGLIGSQGRRTSSTEISETSRLQRAKPPVMTRMISQSALAYVQVQLRRSTEDMTNKAAAGDEVVQEESTCDPRQCTLIDETGYDSRMFEESEIAQPKLLRWSQVTPE